MDRDGQGGSRRCSAAATRSWTGRRGHRRWAGSAIRPTWSGSSGRSTARSRSSTRRRRLPPASPAARPRDRARRPGGGPPGAGRRPRGQPTSVAKSLNGTTRVVRAGSTGGPILRSVAMTRPVASRVYGTAPRTIAASAQQGGRGFPRGRPSCTSYSNWMESTTCLDLLLDLGIWAELVAVDHQHLATSVDEPDPDRAREAVRVQRCPPARDCLPVQHELARTRYVRVDREHDELGGPPTHGDIREGRRRRCPRSSSTRPLARRSTGRPARACRHMDQC